MSELPVIALTMGDPAGIGPETIVKALAGERVRAACRPVVVGDRDRLVLAADRSGVAVPSAPVIQVGELPADLPFGRVSTAAGEAAFRYLERAIELAMAGEVEALCTAPINKEALNAAGHRFPGHTELLAHLTGTKEVSMLLSAPGLDVIHVTTHVGLLEAIRRIEPGLVHRTIRRGNDVFARAGVERPRIGVCGINPHAGEGGLFGEGEEEAKVAPAIASARSEGIDVQGPLPADTLFYRARRGDFDLVVAMYHDQGHGPVKVLGLESGVNVTVGLPFVRTSVDHGTAFDIAGTGVADERSLVAAIARAADLVGRPR